MTFAQKIKQLRTQQGMSQTQLGDAVGVSLRTVRGWETEGRYPKRHALYAQLAQTLSCDISYLMTEKESFITEAAEQFGNRGAKDAAALVGELTGLFAGGEMAQEDMDALMFAIQQAYLDAKMKNKKYTPKRYRTEDDGNKQSGDRLLQRNDHSEGQNLK